MTHTTDEACLPAAFARFLDPPVFHALLQDHCALLGSRLLVMTNCERVYTRYKSYLRPSSWEKASLTFCYRSQGVNAQGKHEQRLLVGKAYRNGRSNEAYAALRSMSTATGMLPPLHIPALDLLVWYFPHDPALPQLTELTHSQRVMQLLPYHSLPISGPRELSSLAVESRHYRPETRCTLRYVLSFYTNGQPRQCIVYGKTFADDLGYEVARRMSHCWSLASSSPLRVARPLGYSPEVRTIWQYGVEGIAPRAAVRALQSTDPFAAIGRCVAGLHQSPYVLETRVTPAERLCDAYKKARKVSCAFPEFTSTLELLLQQCDDEYMQLPPTRTTLLHGDLHVRQFLLVDGQALLFDFDEFTTGDPEQDLANFLVDLLCECDNAELVVHLARAFLQGYRSQVSWEVSEVRLAWHMRIQLLNKAYRLYLQQEPQLRGRIRKALAFTQTAWCAPTPQAERFL